MMRIRHPEPWIKRRSMQNGRSIAFLTLIIFALCFVPFPIQIN